MSIEKFYKRKPLIKKTILNSLTKDNIVYGSKAIDIQLPRFLRIQSTDYDIYSSNPKKFARLLERTLDRELGGNYFKVVPAEYKDTIKIKSRIDGKTYADITKRKGKIKFVNIRGVNYAEVSVIRKEFTKRIKSGREGFRIKKDKDYLNRMNVGKKLKSEAYWGF